MPISYRDIKNERQWKASTGLSEQQFMSLSKLFAQSYEQLYGTTMSDRKGNSSQESTFKTYEDLLFFTLYSIKSGLTYDLLGLTFGLERSNAHQNQAIGLGLLRSALAQGDYLPKRIYESVQEFKDDWAKESEIIIDGTEQRSQRSENEETQKKDYSGKKKPTR